MLISITVSLVDSSLSTVMLLKLSSFISFNSACNTGLVIFASVNMKPSIVAIFGAIMPDPLAIPFIITFLPSINVIASLSLGNVSVVIIALAALSQLDLFFSL